MRSDVPSTPQSRPPVAAIALLALAGCYGSHVRDARVDPVDGGCPADRPRCATRVGPCEPMVLALPECDGTAWSCPAGSRPYERPWTEDRCLPLAGRAGAPFPGGVHEAPVPVPIGETCAWVLPLDRGTPGDPAIDLVATEAAPRCDAIPDPGDPIVDLAGDADWAAIQASFTLADGSVRVLARGWSLDPSAPFGVRSLGVGLGRVVGSRIVVDDRWLFGDETDLGDAAILHDGFAYAYGCPGPPVWLEEDCIVGRAPEGRVDDPAAWSVLGDAGWGAGARIRVFGSGPHRSAVIADPRGGGLVHVYAIGFGRELLVQRAAAPEGPWTEPVALAPCDLPEGDPGAYCAGPIVYRELHDPLAPGVLVIGYSVGTTSEDGAERRARDPLGYWPRIVRVPVP